MGLSPEETRAIKRLSMLTRLQGILIGVFVSVLVVLASMYVERHWDFLFFGATLQFGLLMAFSFILEGGILLLRWKREDLRAQLPGIWRSRASRSTSSESARLGGLLAISVGIFGLILFSLPEIGLGFSPFLVVLLLVAAFGADWALQWFEHKRSASQAQASAPGSESMPYENPS